MKINFVPQRLAQSLALEEKFSNGVVRRLISTPKNKTIEMTLSNLDSLGNVYPKGYYVTSAKTYDKKGMLVKSIERKVTGSTNSETTVKEVRKNVNGKFINYNTYSIVRNNDNVAKIDLNK